MSKFNALNAVAVGAAMVVSASAASAQGASPWTGLYLGVHAGYDTAKPKDGGNDSSLSGFGGGVYGGYNYQINQIVLGLEGDYTLTNGSRTETGAGFTAKSELDDAWSFRARLGFLAASNLLIYGTAGYGSFGITVTETVGTVSTKFSGDFRGLVAGGGVEYAFTRNILGRVEALHTMGKGTGDMKDSEANLTQIRAGIAYRF